MWQENFVGLERIFHRVEFHKSGWVTDWNSMTARPVAGWRAVESHEMQNGLTTPEAGSVINEFISNSEGVKWHVINFLCWGYFVNVVAVSQIVAQCEGCRPGFFLSWTLARTTAFRFQEILWTLWSSFVIFLTGYFLRPWTARGKWPDFDL